MLIAKLVFVDRPTLKLSQQTELREQKKTEATLELSRTAERREELNAEIDRQSKRLDIIKGLALVEEELVRKEAKTAEREAQLKQINERCEHQIGELRQQVDAKEKERAAEFHNRLRQSERSAVLQSHQAEKIKRLEKEITRSKGFEELQSQQAEEIKCLEEQIQHSERREELCCQRAAQLEDELRECREQLSETDKSNHQCSEKSEDDQNHSEPDGNLDLLEAAYKMQTLKPARKELELERRLHSMTEAKHTAESSMANVQKELDTAKAKIETHQSELHALEEHVKELQSERDQSHAMLAAKITACRCGHMRSIETCRACAHSRSTIRALRQEVSGESFGGSETKLLSDLDPARRLNELVFVLCERLRHLMRAVHVDLLPRVEDLETKHSDARASIANYGQKLDDLRYKVRRLKDQLAQAQSESSEAVANARRNDSQPAQQTSGQRSTWWFGSGWTFR
jgi:DNA repair exonuclease SbcCD ATPase subunit